MARQWWAAQTLGEGTDRDARALGGVPPLDLDLLLGAVVFLGEGLGALDLRVELRVELQLGLGLEGQQERRLGEQQRGQVQWRARRLRLGGDACGLPRERGWRSRQWSFA